MGDLIGVKDKQCPKCGSMYVKIDIGNKIKKGPYHKANFVCSSCGYKSRTIRIKQVHNDVLEA